MGSPHGKIGIKRARGEEGEEKSLRRGLRGMGEGVNWRRILHRILEKQVADIVEG